MIISKQSTSFKELPYITTNHFCDYITHIKLLWFKLKPKHDELMEGITFFDGSPFSIENVLPKPDGYQIVHKKSGKYLPQTIGRELYSKAAAIKKMNAVATMYRNDSSFDIFNYKLVSIYKWELKYVHLKFIYDADDKLFD